MDQEGIMDFTQAPPDGNWYFEEGQSEEELKQLFLESMEFLFPEGMREKMKGEDYSSLIAEPLEKGGILYSYVYTEIFEEGEDFFESSIILTFQKVADVWKLTVIQVAG